MSNNNLHRIFDSTVCISTEKMIEYLEGKLLEKDKNSIETHLSSCSMCHDEFEGLQMISDKSTLSGTVFELNDKVDNILANTNKKIPFLMPINLMAAIILFLIGFAWYATYYINATFRLKEDLISQQIENDFQKTDGEILILRPESAISEDKKDQENIKAYKRILEENGSVSNPISDKTELHEVTNKEIAVSEESVSAGNDVEENNSGIINIEKPVADDSKISENETKIGKEDLAKKDREEKKIADELNDINLASSEKDIPNATSDTNLKGKKKSNFTKAKSSKEISNTAHSNNFSLAMAEFDKRDYKAAVELFKLSLNEQEHQDKVYFYLAMSNEKMESYQEALTNYNRVISNKESSLFEQALWNKSQILLKLDKRKSAINTLNQIKNTKGTFSKQAENVLDSLNIK